MGRSMKDEHWKIEAYHAARKALKRHVVPFVAEKLRADVEAVIGPAHDGRSFGAVIQRLKAERVIKRAGIGRAKSSHFSLKPRWARCA